MFHFETPSVGERLAKLKAAIRSGSGGRLTVRSCRRAQGIPPGVSAPGAPRAPAEEGLRPEWPALSPAPRAGPSHPIPEGAGCPCALPPSPPLPGGVGGWSLCSCANSERAYRCG